MAKTTIALAEALLRRKELQGKVKGLQSIKEADVYEVKVTRKAAHEGVDDIVAKVPKLTASQVTREFDWHARQLREIDAVIQQANWVTKVEVNAENMADFKE